MFGVSVCHSKPQSPQLQGLSTCDATLCEPEVRALIERECAMVATAELTSAEVLRRNVALFQGKFQRMAGAMNEVRNTAAR